jgi:hypothetical protein
MLIEIKAQIFLNWFLQEISETSSQGAQQKEIEYCAWKWALYMHMKAVKWLHIFHGTPGSSAQCKICDCFGESSLNIRYSAVWLYFTSLI